MSFFDNDPLSSAGPVLEGEVIIDDVMYFIPQPPGGDEPVIEWSFTGAGEAGAYQIQLTGTRGCAPTTRAECMNGGWRNYDAMFKNQGQCIASVSHP